MKDEKLGKTRAFFSYVIILMCLYFASIYQNAFTTIVTWVVFNFAMPIAALFIFVHEFGTPKVHPKKEKKPEDKKIDIMFWIVIAFYVVWIIPRIWIKFKTGGEISHNQEMLNRDAETQSFELQLFKACIIAPLGEEAIFRFLPAKFLKNGILFVGISSFIFAYAHCFTSANPMLHMPEYIGVSLMLGYVYYRSERLIFSTLLHAAVNFVSGGFLAHFFSS